MCEVAFTANFSSDLVPTLGHAPTRSFKRSRICISNLRRRPPECGSDIDERRRYGLHPGRQRPRRRGDLPANTAPMNTQAAATVEDWPWALPAHQLHMKSKHHTT